MTVALPRVSLWFLTFPAPPPVTMTFPGAFLWLQNFHGSLYDCETCLCHLPGPLYDCGTSWSFYNCETSWVLSTTLTLPVTFLWLRCDCSFDLCDSDTSWDLYDYGTSWGLFLIVVENLWLRNFLVLSMIVILPVSSLWLCLLCDWHFLAPLFDCVVTPPWASVWLSHFLGSIWLRYFLGLLYNYSWKCFAYHSDIWYSQCLKSSL